MLYFSATGLLIYFTWSHGLSVNFLAWLSHCLSNGVPSILIKHESCLSVCVSVCPHFPKPPKVPDSWYFGSRPFLGQLKTRGRQVAQIRYRYREILEYYSWVLAHTRGYSSIESQYSRILKYWISVLVPTSVRTFWYKHRNYSEIISISALTPLLLLYHSGMKIQYHLHCDVIDK